MLYRLSVILTLIFVPVAVYADFGLGTTAGTAGLTQYGDSLQASIGTVVGALLSLIGVIFFVMILYGGIMWMTSAGNQDLVKKSLNTVISAAIGLIVVLSAYAITSFVLESVGPGGGGGPTVPEGQSEACFARGGTCGDPASCAGGDGTTVEGICPGDGTNVCCVPPDGGGEE